MSDQMKKPKSPVKKVEKPKSESRMAETTIAVLAAQAGKENQVGTKRTTGKK